MASERGPDDPAAVEAEEAALARAMEETPRGTVVLAGTIVALMMLCWFAIYLFVFLPRGSVG